ncbi:unnamed protein product [Trichobilharzia regenti]|nr:unnamed protein product [Trichobilharzia regenti]
MTTALYRWLTNHRSRTSVNSEDEAANESPTASTIHSESTDRETANQGIRYKFLLLFAANTFLFYYLSDSQQKMKFPIDYLTDDYISNVMKSAPRCRQIKASTFWGRNFILSGSECGHLIGWDRVTGKPVIAIKADASVVNRIIPHPQLPIIAVSGIDRSIKIIEPDPNVYEENANDDSDGSELSAFQRVVKQHEEEAGEVCGYQIVHKLFFYFIYLRNDWLQDFIMS